MTIQNFTKRALTAAGVAAMLCVAPMIFGQAKKAAGNATKGKSVFEDNCSVCHNADSTEKKGGPGLKGLMKKAKMNNGKAPTEANVRAIVNAGGSGMPSFADQLTDEERDNVIAYLKTL
jgi:cytochrome c